MSEQMLPLMIFGSILGVLVVAVIGLALRIGQMPTRREMNEMRAELRQEIKEAVAAAVSEITQEMRSQFALMHQEMNARFDAVDRKFEAMNAKIEAGDARIEEQVNGLRQEMNARFEATDAKIEAGRPGLRSKSTACGRR